MIDITKQDQKCFAYVFEQCTILTETNCEGCKFYKPEGCDDWVRLEVGERVLIIEPEEYERFRGRRKK
jgi:predicted Fe-S protein YdhL (DUF1289 family)